jgi:hypothetical protein
MVDQCPFLLEGLAWVDNNTFLFEWHFKVTCDLLPPPTCTCLHPFKQLIEQQMVWFKKIILKHLHHIDPFFLSTIKVFGCLHKWTDVFWYDCANAIWSLKGLEGLHLFVLVTFFYQKISITLQKVQMSSILSWMVAICLTTSRLPPLQNTPSIDTTDLL